MDTQPSRLDYVVPEWHFREAHSIEIGAPTADVMAAVREVTWDEARLAKTLMRFGKSEIVGDHRIVHDFQFGAGEAFMEATEDEIVFGGLSTLQKPLDTAGRTAEEFREFNEPGHTKSGLNLRYRHGALTVESRLYCTDRATVRSFRPYWLLIRLPSGQARLSLLRAIARRVLRQKTPS